MFRKSTLAAALMSAASVSSSFAGFTVTATKVSVSGFDRYDIVAINTGGGTGTQIKGLEYFYNGAPVQFQVDDTDEDGTPDTVNLLSTSRTRIRVSTTGANNVFVGQVPTNGYAQPNSYTSGVTSFSGAIANTGTTNASGTGFQIARIFVPMGQTFTFSGNLGGDIGSKTPFSVGPCRCTPVPAPVILTGPPTSVVFGSVVTNGAPFSVSVTVTSTDPTDVLSLAVASNLPGLSNIAVSGAAGPSPRTFMITGIVDYSLNGTTVIVPIQASGLFRTSTGSFQLHITPEPVSALLPCALVRRRRRPGWR